MRDRNGNVAVSEAEFEAALGGGTDPRPGLDDYRAAVDHLARWARDNRHSSTGRQMWAGMASLAFGGPRNAVDLGAIASTWDNAHLVALTTAVAGRGRHGWPTDVMPDHELQAWLDATLIVIDPLMTRLEEDAADAEPS